MLSINLPITPCPEYPEEVFSFPQSIKGLCVLAFYPKDNTSGCSREMSDFRDLYPAFLQAGCMVFGVSRDSLPSHRSFREKLGLPFPLIADTEEKLCRHFDLIQEKSLYGRKYMGVVRSSFVVGRDGVVVQAWRNVKVPNHAATVLAFVRDLPSQG